MAIIEEVLAFFCLYNRSLAMVKTYKTRKQPKKREQNRFIWVKKKIS